MGKRVAVVRSVLPARKRRADTGQWLTVYASPPVCRPIPSDSAADLNTPGVSCPATDNYRGMELVLWQALAGTRGGPNRARILQALDDRPRNPNQLAEDLDLAYNTIRHHLEVLEKNGIVASSTADYGTVYMPSDRTKDHWTTVEEIVSQEGG